MSDRAKLVVSIDLELAWGLQRPQLVEEDRQTLQTARTAVPRLLALFEEYGVRATWAAVGLLFCESKDEVLHFLPDRIPTTKDTQFSPYTQIARIGESEAGDPFHYAPSLIDSIAAAPGQEVASHGFANFHSPFQEPPEDEVFEADLRAAIDVARRRGMILRSLVFPGNQISARALEISARLGITAVRGRPPIWPYDEPGGADAHRVQRRLRRWGRALDTVIPLTRNRCVRSELSTTAMPVDVTASRHLRPLAATSRWLASMQRRRIATELDFAARNGGLYHLWWRAREFGSQLETKLDELRRLLDRFDGWRRLGKMDSVTMHEVVMGAQDWTRPMPRASSLG